MKLNNNLCQVQQDLMFSSYGTFGNCCLDWSVLCDYNLRPRLWGRPSEFFWPENICLRLQIPPTRLMSIWEVWGLRLTSKEAAASITPSMSVFLFRLEIRLIIVRCDRDERPSESARACRLNAASSTRHSGRRPAAMTSCCSALKIKPAGKSRRSEWWNLKRAKQRGRWEIKSMHWLPSSRRGGRATELKSKTYRSDA